MQTGLLQLLSGSGEGAQGEAQWLRCSDEGWRSERAYNWIGQYKKVGVFTGIFDLGFIGVGERQKRDFALPNGVQEMNKSMSPQHSKSCSA